MLKILYKLVKRQGHRVKKRGPKVQDVEILLPVRFRWIPFSCFRGDVEYVSVNHPENTNLVEDVEILLPVNFRWIRFSGFRGEVENFSANQRPWRQSCFSDWSKKQIGRGRSDLASCQVSLNSVQWFQGNRKCEKLTTDGRLAMYDHNSVLEPLAQAQLVHHRIYPWIFIG